jgi:TolA-binding protein
MRVLTILLPVALLAPFACAQKINDVVLKKDGARVRGVEITEFLLSGVRGKRGNDPFELPAHQIAGVEWHEPPEAFVAGRGAMDRGNYQSATQLFGSVQSDRALVKADADFFMIKCAVYAIGNDKAAAATAAERARKWLADNPNHWRTPEALLLTGRAERLAGTGGQAATTLRELDERAIRDGFGAVWSARAKYELALTLVADGKASEARTQFQSASSAADTALNTDSGDRSELLALKTLARVGEGETYLNEKDYAKAESFFREMAKSNQPELVGAGHAGEGEAIFLAAVANNKKDDIRRAQLSLARASVLDQISGEASAKANYYLGRCLLELGPEREGDAFKQRAQAYFQITYSNYPTTQWASLARLEASK